MSHPDKSSEARFRALFENAADSIFLLREEVFVECNAATLEMFGCHRDEIIGKRPYEYSPPNQPDGRTSKDKAWEKIEAAFAGTPQRFQWVHIRRDRTPFTAEVRLNRVEIGGEMFLQAIVRDLTTEQTSKEEVRAIVETSRDWIWTIDLNNIHTYSNPAVETILGYQPDEIVGKAWSHLLHPDDLKIVETLMPGWIKEKSGWGGLVLRWRHKNGAYRFLESNAVTILSPSGKLIGFRGVDRDITERKEAEWQLELGHCIVSASSVGITVYKATGDCVLVNDAAAELVGAKREQLLQLNFRKLKLWQDTGLLDKAEQTLSLGEERELESRATTSFGKEVLLRCRLVPFRFQDEIHLMAMYEDVTKRRQAEENLQHALSEIRKLKERAEAENVYLLEEIRMAHLHGDMIGRSEAMMAVLTQAEQVAEAKSTVLIHGETGTGKELLARAIHNMSPRREHPLVVVNCAAMPSTLLESEMFGREKGAYTGALTKQVGRFELANGSTIFLDEIGELSAEAQAKLLRVLQEGEIQRLGSAETIQVDVRVIAATNRDLDEEVEQGRFREDLFYRLNVFPITIPPLRERRDDIPALVWHFVGELGEHMGKSVDTVSKRTMAQLQRYSWPGNIRELRNTIERAMIRSKGPVLQVIIPTGPGSPGSAPTALDDIQRQHIVRILDQTDWRVRGKHGAAELLGLKPSTLESRMTKLGIKRPR